MFRRLIHVFAQLAASRRLRRELREAPQLALADVPENQFARVRGIVRPLDARLLDAPLTGRLCVYYAIIVREVSHDSVLNVIPAELGSDHDGMAFVLADGDAHAVIDPAHARISAEYDHESASKAAFDATPRQRAVLERLGLIKRDWFSTAGLLYREAVLEVDEAITVLGAGTLERDPEAAPTGLYREGVPMRLRFTGTRKHPLAISDDPRSV